MLAEAFGSVQFPILPVIKASRRGEIEFYHRNPRLFTPSDFDYSPYFEIIKYPFFELAEHVPYRKLPWRDEIINDPEQDDFPIEELEEIEEEDADSADKRVKDKNEP